MTVKLCVQNFVDDDIYIYFNVKIRGENMRMLHEH